MSEPTGDSPPTQSIPAANVSATPTPESSAAAPGTQPAPLTPAPRVNPPSVYNPRDAVAPAAAPPGFSDLLAWMQALGAAPVPPTAVNPAAPRTPLAKEQKKFHRQGPETVKNDKTPAAGDASPGDTAAPGGPLAPYVPGETPTMVRRRRPQMPGAQKTRSYRFLLPWLILLALLSGSFVLGRLTAARNAQATAAASPRNVSDHPDLSPRNASLIDQAMTAEQKRDFAQATTLLEQVRADQNHVTGIDYHLALLALESGDMPRAMSLLDRSIEEGEEVAASYNLRGTMVNRQGGINKGLPGLETATQVDPFNAKYFFFLGEALRRAGKPQAALVALRRALDRLRDPSLESIYRLKERLTLLDLGQDNEFAPQLATEVQRPVPSIDWLFTAAAVEMHQGHFDTAASYLDRVLTLTDQETADIRLRDYFFYGFAREKSLARFYANILKTAAAPGTEEESSGKVAPHASPEIRDAPSPESSPNP